ncbi:hypothetical protein MalM25_06950 [Planctomycetes bacterium MalM25]|nr:hypothetical protein MalM25_06950 [Planctomycetes bacterium MalM25]
MAANHRDETIAPSQANPGFNWAPLLVALVAPALILQVAVVRPTSNQLAHLRGQIAGLEATIDGLKAQEPTAGRTAGLLAKLAEQQDCLAGAEASIDRFAKLEARLARGVADADRAAEALDRLEGLVERVENQSDLLNDAHLALNSLADAPAELHAAIDRAGRIAPSVGQVERLAAELGRARELTEESFQRVESLVAVQESLGLEAERIAAANEKLDGLARLESRLNAPLLAVGASHERLDALLRLKDAVLAQTDDLPEAYETFELVVDLQADYQKARTVFRTMQRLLADLVLLEPSISRIAAVVDPMIDRTSLGRLGGSELRMVLREMRDRRAVALAELEQSESEEVAASSSATIK